MGQDRHHDQQNLPYAIYEAVEPLVRLSVERFHAERERAAEIANALVDPAWAERPSKDLTTLPGWVRFEGAERVLAQAWDGVRKAVLATAFGPMASSNALELARSVPGSVARFDLLASVARNARELEKCVRFEAETSNLSATTHAQLSSLRRALEKAGF